MRFRSVVEEISPEANALAPSSNEAPQTLGDPGEVSPEDLRALSKSLRASPLQERRMNIFGYEAFSLPASRVCTSWQLPYHNCASLALSVPPCFNLPASILSSRANDRSGRCCFYLINPGIASQLRYGMLTMA